MIVEDFSGLSHRDFGLQVAARLNARYGLRLEAIADNGALSLRERRRAMAHALAEAVLGDLHDQRRREGWPEDRSLDTDAVLARLDGGVEIEPNMLMSEKTYRIVQTYQGDELKNYLFTLTKRFETMSKATMPGTLALEMSTSSIASVGITMARYTIKALREGSKLVAAIRTGITSVGLGTALVVVVLILAALLLYLLLENPKKILGMIINDTDETFVVQEWRKGLTGGTDSDLFMMHGHMENFMEDHETEDFSAPPIQLRERFWFGPGSEDNHVCCGLFFADRNVGFRGAEGMMVFRPDSNSDVGIALQFAVPYVNDNGTNMRRIEGPTPNRAEFYRELYDSRSERHESVAGGYRLISTVSGRRGGVVGLIASIEKP